MLLLTDVEPTGDPAATLSLSAPVMVRIENVSKFFGSTKVLHDVSLEVGSGEVVVLIGASGSGKTTLLRCVNCLEHPSAGRIYVDGVPMGVHRDGGVFRPDPESVLNKKRAQIGMVFQRFNLFSHLTALENVTLAPMMVKGLSKSEARDLGIGLLRKVGLGDKLAAYPSKLSGGQQQRVAIARALVNDPAVILADEPTGNLDTRTSVEILALLQKLNRQGLTIVLVTHETDIATYASRRLVFRDGRLRTDECITPLDAAEALKTLPEEEEQEAAV